MRINSKKGGISVDWNVIKAEYIAGGTSYRKLAAKYGVSKTTLEQRAKKEDWIGLRRQTQDKTATKMTEVVSELNAKDAEEAARLINESSLNMLRQIAEDTARGNVNDKYFPVYARALGQLKEVLGIKTPLELEEQKARIDNLRRQADQNEVTDTVIEFEFVGETEDYSK